MTERLERSDQRLADLKSWVERNVGGLERRRP
jgi:hypothetical protein